jgi:DNA-binding response OmpR family regulator
MPGIAIIEHDALMRALLAEWLAAEGYDVIDGSRGDGAAANADVDLVIVDVYMPRALGVERLREARIAYPGVPIVAISAQFRAGVSCEGYAARVLGVERVVAKPFDRQALVDAVRSVTRPPVASVRQGA